MSLKWWNKNKMFTKPRGQVSSNGNNQTYSVPCCGSCKYNAFLLGPGQAVHLVGLLSPQLYMDVLANGSWVDS